MTYQAFLNKQMKRADSLGKEREAIKLLVLELSGLDGANFFLKLTEELPVEEEKRFLTAIDKYLIDGIPVQHILGYSYFYGYRMIVNKEVLIPRPETEELVGYVLQKYDDVFDGQKVDVVDVGTGSGAVAVALVKEEPNMSVYGKQYLLCGIIYDKCTIIHNQRNSGIHVPCHFPCGNIGTRRGV